MSPTSALARQQSPFKILIALLFIFSVIVTLSGLPLTLTRPLHPVQSHSTSQSPLTTQQSQPGQPAYSSLPSLPPQGLDLTGRPEAQITENGSYLPNLPEGLYPAWVATQQKEAGVEYSFAANGVANNPAQALKLGLGEQGVKINGWEMGLTGVGYEGQSLDEVGSSQPSLVAANRVEYRRGQGLREWYVNGPVGLEQGFALEQPWPGTAGSGSEEWLSLQVRLREASAHLSGSEGQALEIVGADGTVAHYSGLYAYDARGQKLESRMELDESGQGWRLLVKVSGASYPVVVDPLVQQQELTASDGAGYDDFGYSVALSSDGSTAIVGAYQKKIGANNNQGAAYIFTRSSGVWSQQQRLTAGDGAASDYFGVSVALSSDGNTAIVGAYNKKIGANSSQGAAYIFTRSGTTWSQQQELTAGDGAANDYFGWSVGLSSDGSTAIVGAYNKKIGANGAQGAAYIFTGPVGLWSQQQELTASDGVASDRFGWSVALSGDGSTAIVGAITKKLGANPAQGAAYIFTRAGPLWGQQQELTASDGSVLDELGFSVGLSSDGNTAIVGAFQKRIGGNFAQGAAYIFTRSGSVWSQQQELTASDGVASDYFGWSVGLSSDGNTGIVGAYQKTIGANSLQGAAYIFIQSGGVWSQQQKLTASDGATNDEFGYSVALSGDGNTGIVGAYQKAVGGTVQQGAAYTFGLSTTLTLTSSPNPSTLGQSVTFTATVVPVGASGTVTFTEGATTLGTGTLSGGVATFSSSNLSGGSHVISATYGGGSSYVSSSSNTVTQVVNQASTTTALTSTPNPSTFGQSVTFTATVSPISATGTVTFTEGATILGTGTLSGGVATFNSSNLSGGSHVISATYSGNSNYTGGSSNIVTQVVNRASTTLTLTSTPNPSSLGQSVTFTATVSSVGASGTVTFTEGLATLGTGTVSGGVATFSTTSLSPGSHDVSATYGGDSSYSGNSSNTVTQVVNRASTTLTLTSALNPSTSGQSVIFTATVSAISASGTVTFTEGATTLGIATLTNGMATFNTSSLGVGSHAINATYGGDSTYLGSTSNTVTQVVNPGCDPLVVNNGAVDTEDCGTLRAAIIKANTLIATQNVTITVNPSYIGLGSPLPALTNTGPYTLTVSAPCGTDSNNGGRGVPITQLNGGITVGLTLGDRVVVRGFRFTSFTSYGVVMSGSYSSISCSWIGTGDGTNPADVNSGYGISVTGSNNTVGGSNAQDGVLISGNGGTGLSVSSGGKVSLQNVWIGLAKDGVTTLRNGKEVKVASGGKIYFGRGNRTHV